MTTELFQTTLIFLFAIEQFYTSFTIYIFLYGLNFQQGSEFRIQQNVTL